MRQAATAAGLAMDMVSRVLRPSAVGVMDFDAASAAAETVAGAACVSANWPARAVASAQGTTVRLRSSLVRNLASERSVCF